MNFFNLPFLLMDPIDNELGTIFTIFLFLGIALIITYIIWKNFFHNSNTIRTNKKHFLKTNPNNKRINRKILANYYKQGLNDSDIDYFRQIMASALKQINQIETISRKNQTLSSLTQEYQISQLLHGFFKEIVAKPQKIDVASDFLYKELPTLVTLYTKFNEIDGYIYKDHETKKVLKISQNAIKNAYQKINDEYHKFITEDLETLHDAANNF